MASGLSGAWSAAHRLGAERHAARMNRVLAVLGIGLILNALSVFIGQTRPNPTARAQGISIRRETLRGKA
jgi:hypothetical protein